MNKNYKINLDNYTRIIQKATCTFLRYIDKKVIQIGTGVFVSSDDEIYLLSAGHVFTIENYFNMFIPIPNSKDVIKVGELGDLNTTYVEGQVASKDAGYTQILPEMKDKILRHYTPLPKSKIKTELNLYPIDERFFIFGYPSTKAKFRFETKKQMSFNPVRITTHAFHEIKKYEELDFSIVEHIIVKLQRKIPGNTGRRFLPKLNGISGCGMYYLPKLYEPDNQNTFFLIGIMTDADFEDQYGTSVRMDVFSKLVENRYNEILASTSLNMKISNKEEE